MSEPPVLDVLVERLKAAIDRRKAGLDREAADLRYPEAVYAGVSAGASVTVGFEDLRDFLLSAESTVSRLSEALRPFAEAWTKAALQVGPDETPYRGELAQFVQPEHFRAALSTLDQGKQGVTASGDNECGAGSQANLAGPDAPSVDGKGAL